MANLIDKDALVSEIERRIKNLYPKGGQGLVVTKILKDHYEDLLVFIDTLKVKGVDLEKEIDNFYGMYRKNGITFSIEDNQECLDWKVDCNPNFEKAFAKHFFELGLKTQHDNWKVVDNKNLPQVGGTKIYCVFTKQQYILATVINHPKDEDLLQWKCTEFPFNRYDMCEGDKYLVIN